MVVKKQGGKGSSTAMKGPFLSQWFTPLKGRRIDRCKVKDLN